MSTKPVSIAAFAAALAFTGTAVRAQDDVTVSTIPVADNIHMLTGKGGNIGLFVGADGTFLIDDQFAPLTEKILAAIKSVGGDTPKYLINTHFHGDHSGGIFTGDRWNGIIYPVAY